MKTFPNPGSFLRIILISLFVALLGLAPQPHTAVKLLSSTGQSMSRGDLITASQNLAEAGEILPWRYDLYLVAGRLAMQSGDPKAAIQYLEHTGTVSHLTDEDILLLADAYFQSGDSFMAEAIWKHAVESDNSTQANERLADLYLQRKDYPSALNALKNLLAINPSDIHLYYQIGSLYSVTDPIQSLPYLIQAVEIDPTNSAHAQTLHDKIRTAGLFEEPAYTSLEAGRQLADWGEWQLAAAAFKHAIALYPGYADAWAFLGEARQQISAQESGTVSKTGLSELEYALQLNPNSTLANTLMGLFWRRQDDLPRAQLYLEHAIEVSPEDPYLYSELGNILARAGDLPSAQSAYENAIQLAPRDALFYRLMAEFALQYQIQIRELALPAARQAITINPIDASSLDVMAQVMLFLQDYHSAQRYAHSALQADPDYPPAYLHLGTAYLYLGEPALARQWLNLAQDIDPDSWIASQAKRMLEYYFP